MSRHRRHRSTGISRTLRRSRLFQTFRKDHAFAYAFGAFMVVIVGIAIAVPKIWTSVPADFPYTAPKISLIDRVQAWSLARTARRAEAAGQYEAAIYAWRASTANNPGDPNLRRGILATLRDVPETLPEYDALVGATTRWLTALTGTNSVDAILIADVLERYGFLETALTSLKRFPEGGTDIVERARARCYFSSEQFEEFARLWRANEAKWASDPDMSLYRDAWLMATDDGTPGLEGAMRMKAAIQRPGLPGVHAARLLHLAAARKGLVADLDLAIRRLEEGQAATFAQYGQLWRLLAASGREEEARSRARSFLNKEIRDARSAARYTENLRALKLTSDAIDFLDRNIEKYGLAVEVWRNYFDLLIEVRNWGEVRRVSAAARIHCSRRDALYAEALFADYLATRAQDRQAEATDLLRELSTIELADPTAATRIAGGLRQDGRPEQALALLQSNEKVLANSPAFWTEWFSTGRALKDITLLRRAVSELVRINPQSPIWMNNRAALLLITGENPAEALQLTLAGLGRQPNSIAFQINHAIALLMNGRAADARTLLNRIDPGRLDADAATNYHLALAEVHAAEGRTDQAVAAARKVERDRLLPQQAERLDKVLGPAGAAGRRT